MPLFPGKNKTKSRDDCPGCGMPVHKEASMLHPSEDDPKVLLKFHGSGCLKKFADEGDKRASGK